MEANSPRNKKHSPYPRQQNVMGKRDYFDAITRFFSQKAVLWNACAFLLLAEVVRYGLAYHVGDQDGHISTPLLAGGVLLIRVVCLTLIMLSLLQQFPTFYKLLEKLNGVLGLWFLIAILWIAWYAIPYPYELEWCESSALNMVERVYKGLPIYTTPSLEYTPQAYNPLYYYLCGYLAKISGISLPTCRLVSLCAFIVTLLGLYAFVTRETRNWKAGSIAIFCYAAFFELSGAWVHLARVDSTYVLLLFVGTLLAHKGQKHWHVMLSAFCLFLALLVKQTVALYLPFITLYLLFFRRTSVKSFVPTISGLIACSILLGNLWTDGIYYFYAYGFQTQRTIRLKVLSQYVRSFALPLLCLLLLTAALWYQIRKKSPSFFRQSGFYLIMTGSSLLISLAAMSQGGGYYNNMMPTYLFLALCIGLGMHVFIRSSQDHFLRSGYSLLLCITFVFLLYNPTKYIPTAADYAAGEIVLNALSGAPEPVWIPETTSYYYLTGRKSYTHWMNLTDIQRSGSKVYQRKIEQEMQAALEQKMFAAVILAENIGELPQRLIRQGYQKQELLPDSDGLAMKTGDRRRPEMIFYRTESILSRNNP